MCLKRRIRNSIRCCSRCTARTPRAFFHRPAGAVNGLGETRHALAAATKNTNDAVAAEPSEESRSRQKGSVGSGAVLATQARIKGRRPADSLPKLLIRLLNLFPTRQPAVLCDSRSSLRWARGAGLPLASGMTTPFSIWIHAPLAHHGSCWRRVPLRLP